ncbi:MAG: hypothetical protein ABIF92_02760 [archaeon]
MPPKSQGKNIFLHHETVLIVSIIIAALVLTTTLFLVLWSFFKLGFVWIVAFLLFFLVRKTNVWKFGLEIHFFLVFLTTYVFGIWFSIPLVILTLAAVLKIRPDELEGCIINFAGLLLEILLVSRIAIHFGPGISETAFLWSAMIVIIIGVILDFFMTLRMYPFLWMKLSVTHVLDIFVQYTFISAVGFSIFHFLLTVV